LRTLGADDFVLCSGTVRRLGVADTARVAAAAGYQGISAYLHEVQAALESGWTLASLRALLDDLDLGVAEIDGRVDWVPGLPPERGTSVEFAIEVAAGLRARSITAIETSGQPVGNGLDFDSVVQGFAALCDRAVAHGVLVHIEYFPFSGIPDLSTAVAVARAAARANGGVLVDVWHHGRGPDDGALAPLTDVASRVFGVQLNDLAPTAAADVRQECMHGRMLPGRGRGTCAAVVAALRQGGCVAPLGVEVFSDELDRLAPEPAARAALTAARSVAAVG
jgi:sugar phosphate isomerase/epimerase